MESFFDLFQNLSSTLPSSSFTFFRTIEAKRNERDVVNEDVRRTVCRFSFPRQDPCMVRIGILNPKNPCFLYLYQKRRKKIKERDKVNTSIPESWMCEEKRIDRCLRGEGKRILALSETRSPFPLPEPLKETMEGHDTRPKRSRKKICGSDT